MALPEISVTIEVDTTLLPLYAFALDSTRNGVLDNTRFRLAGISDINLDNFLRSVDIQRGKSRLLDQFESGSATITFDNTTRAFDPLFENSPLYGAIAPRLEIKVFADDIVQYSGVILDWNLEYNKDNDNIAIAICSDKFTNLAQTQIDVFFPDIQKSGERIIEILDLPEVSFTEVERDIAEGLTTLSGEVIPADTNTLEYLQRVEKTEQGALFIAKNGDLTFQNRLFAGSFTTLFSDEQDGIPFTEIGNVFGTELLFNRISITPESSAPIVRTDETSIEAYGASTFNETTLHEFDEDAEDLADFLLIKYSQPQFRFNKVTTNLSNLTSQQVTDVLNLELNDFVTVKFTPSGIGNPIQQGARILGISHFISKTEHIIEFQLEKTFTFILDSVGLGVLDESIFALE